MAKSLPPLTWFRAFDASARHLSFTAAAEELGLTQSAISQHIRALETRLGAPLFLRKPRGLTLTDAGRHLVPDVAAAMARLRIATDAFEQAAKGDILTVATSVSFAQWFLAPGLPDFRRRFPDVRVRLVTTVWPDDFVASNANVEIRFGLAEVAGGGARQLGNNRLVAVAAPELVRGISADDWKNLLLLPLIQPVGISDSWIKVMKSIGQANCPEPQYFVDTHGLAVDMAVNGVGIALTSALIAAPSLLAGRLVAFPLPDIQAREGYFVAIKGPAEAAEQGFVDWLDERVAGSLSALQSP
jgi:LysR family transcriptional regulator, glycine cleavage system transcriptional activator